MDIVIIIKGMIFVNVLIMEVMIMSIMEVGTTRTQLEMNHAVSLYFPFFILQDLS